MRKILQVTASLKIGGLERVGYNYSKYQQNMDIKYFYLVYGQQVGAYEHDLIENGIRVIHIDKPQHNYLHFIKQVYDVLIEYGPFDAVHSHPSLNSGLIMLTARLARVPIRITHAHTDRAGIQLGLFNRIYNRLMQFFIQKFATTYIGVSENAGNYLFGKDFFDRFGQVILNGIDQEKFIFSSETRERMREKLGLTEEIVLGHTGTLNDVKNQEFMIDLLSNLIKINSSYKLLLVGDGKNRDILEEKVSKLSLKDEVIFIGQTDRPEEYLMAMDIFLFPSKFEGLGLSAVEAQISGLPTIISDQVPKEVIASKNCFQLPLTEEIWIEKISEIERDRNRVGLNLKKFDIYNQVKETERLYEH